MDKQVQSSVLTGKWILAGNKLIVIRQEQHGGRKTGKVPYVRITNSYIMQKDGDFRTIPDFKGG